MITFEQIQKANEGLASIDIKGNGNSGPRETLARPNENGVTAF